MYSDVLRQKGRAMTSETVLKYIMYYSIFICAMATTTAPVQLRNWKKFLRHGFCRFFVE